MKPNVLVSMLLCAPQAAFAQGIPLAPWPPVVSSGTMRVEVIEQAAEPEFLAPKAAVAQAAATGSSPARGGAFSLVESLSMEPIDFSFRDADIHSVLRGFALKFNRNIIAAGNVHGKVNLQLKGVPFDEGFAMLLSQLNLVAVQKGSNVIEVLRIADLPVLVQVFALKYRFAGELEKTITAMLTPRERLTTLVTMDLASNSVIVSSTNDMLQKIKRLVEQLDIESPQISIKARLIEIGAGSALTYGVTWANSSSFNKDGTQGTARAVLDAGNYTVTPVTGKIDTINAITKFPAGGIFDISAVLDGKTYYALLNAIKNDTRTKTISEPMILTGNNKSSKIHVGQNLPVKTSLVSQTATIQSVQYIPEGVDLEVTPIVSPGSDIISIKIRVMVAEFLGFQNDAPVTTERVATTEVAIQSGKTVVIGGLIKDKMSTNDTGVPFLKDIPILGWFFRTHRKSKDKTELLIFITPELLVKPV